MFRNIVRKPNKVARAAVNQALADQYDRHFEGKKWSPLTAESIVAEYGLAFGVYEYDHRLPIDAATQMVRNHLNRAYKAGHCDRRRPPRKRGLGRGPTEYAPPFSHYTDPTWEHIV